jgi:hypothetical protein
MAWVLANWEREQRSLTQISWDWKVTFNEAIIFIFKLSLFQDERLLQLHTLFHPLKRTSFLYDRFMFLPGMMTTRLYYPDFDGNKIF